MYFCKLKDFNLAHKCSSSAIRVCLLSKVIHLNNVRKKVYLLSALFFFTTAYTRNQKTKGKVHWSMCYLVLFVNCHPFVC